MARQQRLIRQAGKNSNLNFRYILMQSSCKLANLFIATWHWCTMNKPVNCTIWWSSDHESAYTLPMRERLTMVSETLLYITNVWIGSNVVGEHVDVQYLHVGEWLDMESEQPQCMTKLLVSDTTTPRGRLQPAIQDCARWRNPGNCRNWWNTDYKSTAKTLQNPANWNNDHHWRVSEKLV